MRLIKHIDEKLSMDERYFRKHGMYHADIITMIEKNCKKFLAELMGGKLLWRGAGTHDFKAGEVLKPRPNRQPRNTPKKVHTHLNKLFKEKFGWKARNGMFVTGGWVPAIYGNEHIFFPIGNYKYVWSEKHEDLYRHPIAHIAIGISDKEHIEQSEKHFKRVLNTYKATDLKGASYTRNEISFKVSKYYMIPNDGELVRLMSEAWNLK
jgi:hypothetical protein